MTIHTLDRFIAGALILFGLWLVRSGTQMGIMQGYVPGAGLFPVLIGGGIVALSLINLIRSLAGFEKLSPGMSRKAVFQALAIIIILVGVVILVPLLGLTLSTFIAMIMVGTVIQHERNFMFAVLLLSVSLLTAVGCRLLFQGILNVPVPTGILGI